MTTFGWLHLTDLHQGAAAQSWMLPEVMNELYRDLEELHGKDGWDLVLFTGDLTQRGTPAEFSELDRTLDALRKKLDQLGSHPVLLAVPGNHDLTRPANVRDPAVRTLLRWAENEDVHDELWTDPDSPYRAVVRKAFTGYAEWWARFGHGFRKPVEMKEGILPGDFSAVIEKEGARLGVVGLNTSFLQLADSVKPGDLALHARQFQAVCDGDGPGWADRCDVSLLMTHHPPAWLDARSRDDHLFANIAVPGRFAVHLFGHMHEASASAVSVAGMEARRFWQGTSLFGLEHFGDGTMSRAHGYAAGRIELRPRDAELRLFPRKAERTQAKSWQIVPDTSFGRLERDQGTRPEAVQRRRMQSMPAPVRPSNPIVAFSSTDATWKPQAPGGPYDPLWHVPRAREEKVAINNVPNRGSPAVVVWGPPLYGKTTFVKHVLARLPAVAGEAMIVEISLGTFDRALDSEHAFFTELGNRIAREASLIPESGTLPAWPADRARERLEGLMEQKILPRDGRLLVLVIEKLDAILPCAFRESVFEMFRRWVQEVTDEPWSALRLIVVAASTPMMFQRKATRSPFFNTSTLIEIREFDAKQTASLAKLYRLSWGDEEIGRLRALVGGHPFLLRAFMYEAALQETPLDELLDPGSAVGQELRQRAARMLPDLDPTLEDALRKVLADRRVRLPDDVYQMLRGAGLLDAEAGVYRFRCKLYEDHFTEQWKAP
jgi:AAA-like domain/Calcineurin-like phosphoesterase